MAAPVRTCKGFTKPKKKGGEPKACTKRATIDDWCGTHYNSYRLEQDEHEKLQAERAAMQERIDAHIAWTREHPSVWDSRPSRSS